MQYGFVNFNVVKMKKNTEGKDTLCEYLNSHQYGELNMLERFDQDELVHFCKMGYMTRGEDAQQHQRYKLTVLGKQQIRMMCTRERLEGSVDKILSILE